MAVRLFKKTLMRLIIAKKTVLIHVIRFSYTTCIKRTPMRFYLTHIIKNY